MKRSRNWWPSAVGGLAGGAAVTVAGAILHTLVSAVPFPPLAIAQVLVRTTPGRFDSFFIDRLGHGAQQLAIVGTCIVFLLLAAALGVAIPWVRRGLLPFGTVAQAAAGPVAFLPLWVASVVLYPSNPQWVGRFACAFIMLPLYMAGGAVAGWALDRLTAQAAEQPADASLPRRYILRAAWLGAAGMLLGASPLGALIFRRPDPGRQRLLGVSATPSPVQLSPQDAQFARVAGLTPEVTSNDEFYVVNEDLIQPDIDPAEWQLSVGGLVDRPLTLTYEDLKSLPVVERYQTLECISNRLGRRLLRQHGRGQSARRDHADRVRHERLRPPPGARVPRAGARRWHVRHEEPEVADEHRGRGPTVPGVLGAARVVQAGPGEDDVADRHARGRGHAERRRRADRGSGLRRRRGHLPGGRLHRRAAHVEPGVAEDGPVALHLAVVVIPVDPARTRTVRHLRPGLRRDRRRTGQGGGPALPHGSERHRRDQRDGGLRRFRMARQASATHAPSGRPSRLRGGSGQ